MASLSRIKSTDSLSQWADKINSIIGSVELFVQTSGSFSSSTPSQSDLVIYDGTQWVNRTLVGPITINTAVGGATGILEFELEDTFISSRTELTLVDTDNDFLLVYDASEPSASKIKKVKPANVSSQVGGITTEIQYNNSGALAGATGFTFDSGTGAVSLVGAFNLTGNLVVDTNVLFVNTSTNRVGIGTATPTTPLDVNGNVNVTGNIVASGTLTGTLTTAAQANITSVGTLTSLSVSGLATLSAGVQTTSITATSGINISAGGLSVTGGISGTLTTASQTNITGIGTITTGTWNASLIAGQYGGTGVANTGKTITVSGNTVIGSSTHTVTLATSGNTSVTLPTSGTLVTSSVATLSSLTSIGTLTALTVSGVSYLNGRLEQNIVDMASGTDVNCSNGNYFIKTISGNTVFTFSNAPSSRSFGFTLELTHTSGTVTWPSSVKWPHDITPTLTTGKTHLFMFVTDDGGTRWRGSALINYTN